MGRSVPTYSMKQETSSSGEASKTKEAEKASAAVAPAGDSFLAKAGEADAPMAKAADDDELPGWVQGALDFLRGAVSVLRRIADWVPGNVGRRARELLQAAERILNTVDTLLRNGQRIGREVLNALRDIFNQIREWLGF